MFFIGVVMFRGYISRWNYECDESKLTINKLQESGRRLSCNIENLNGGIEVLRGNKEKIREELKDEVREKQREELREDICDTIGWITRLHN